MCSTLKVCGMLFWCKLFEVQNVCGFLGIREFHRMITPNSSYLVTANLLQLNSVLTCVVVSS